MIGKFAVAVNIEGHSIRGLNERSVSDGGICVLCGWSIGNPSSLGVSRDTRRENIENI